MKIEVDKLSRVPDDAWEKYHESGRVCKPASMPRLDKPVKKDAVRFVCISDTHETLGKLVGRIPPGDVLIHAGDLTNFGDARELNKVNDILGSLPHKHKIVIGGNHDLGFEDGEDLSHRGKSYRGRGTPQGYKLLTNCTYLQDSETEVYGIRVYGTSWHPLPGYSFSRERGQPLLDKWNLIPEGIDVLVTHTPPLGHSDNFKMERFGTSWHPLPGYSFSRERGQPLLDKWNLIPEGIDVLVTHTPPLGHSDNFKMERFGTSWHPLPGYSFSRERGQPLLDKWNLIPEGIDVLVTHTPPLGHSDNFKNASRWGCVELLNTVEHRVKPRFHVFGHVHEQNGATSNGTTTFINASICAHSLEPINDPIIFDIPMKDGLSKDC